MDPVDVIAKKRDGGVLDPGEIAAFVRGHTRGDIADEQMAAFAMAIYFRGMARSEVSALTRALADSGERLDIARTFGDCVVDKHSTGGVGDTTTLAVVPLVAAAGVPVLKMSGRRLAHTGGTIDKLESIPGFRTRMSREEILAALGRTGAVIVAQMESLAPADGRLYSLRDRTATVDSVPLIASSVMSKKLAVGAGSVVLDVKYGGGALIGDPKRAEALARAMVRVGTDAGIRTVALVTDMEHPLGDAVGNALEVREAVHILMGEGSRRLREMVLALGQEMLIGAGHSPDKATARERLVSLLESGAGLESLVAMVLAQGGDAHVITEPDRLPQAKERWRVRAKEGGYLCKIDGRSIGRLAMALGRGSGAHGMTQDPGAGIILCRSHGDAVHAGDVLAVLHASPAALAERDGLLRWAHSAFSIAGDPPAPRPLVRKVIRAD